MVGRHLALYLLAPLNGSINSSHSVVCWFFSFLLFFVVCLFPVPDIFSLLSSVICWKIGFPAKHRLNCIAFGTATKSIFLRNIVNIIPQEWRHFCVQPRFQFCTSFLCVHILNRSENTVNCLGTGTFCEWVIDIRCKNCDERNLNMSFCSYRCFCKKCA